MRIAAVEPIVIVLSPPVTPPMRPTPPVRIPSQLNVLLIRTASVSPEEKVVVPDPSQTVTEAWLRLPSDAPSQSM